MARNEIKYLTAAKLEKPKRSSAVSKNMVSNTLITKTLIF